MKKGFKYIYDTLFVAIVFVLLFLINFAKFVYMSFFPRSAQHSRFV